MNSIQKKHLHHIVALVTLILVVSGGGGLGILLLRQKISATAEQARQMEVQIASFERRIQQIDSRIASVHRPEYLRERGAAFGLDLRRPEGRQVVRLHAGPLQKDYADRSASKGDALADPLFISLDLALMEPPRRANP